MLGEVRSEPGEQQDLSRAVDLHHQVRRVVAVVVAASRLATLAWSG